MKRSLLKILRCPSCGAEFKLDDGVRTNEGLLRCPHHHLYPIIDGIPRVYEGALGHFPEVIHNHHLRTTQSGKMPVRFRGTQKSYTNWWTRFPSQRTYASSSRAILLNRTMLLPEDFAGKSILDAGTGNGKFLKHLFEFGAREVVAMDLSRGIEEAFELNSETDECHFIQGNNLEPPFIEQAFDGVISIGVLHHTPDPRRAFQRLASLVKSDGFFSVFLYYQSWRPYDRRVFEFLRELKWLCYREPVRFAVTCLPHPLIVAFCATLYAKEWLINSLKKNSLTHWAGKMVEQMTPPGTYLPGKGWRANVAYNYDGYSTRYLYQISFEEALEWFQEAGYNDLIVSPFPLSITGWQRGRNDSNPLRIRYYQPKHIQKIASVSVD